MPVARCSRASLALFALSGTALASFSAHGQDSVSTGNGLPGDAVGAYTIGANSEQVNNYIVDLTVKSSSWGHAYRFGPVAKSSQVGTTFFNHLIGAQSASNRFTSGSFLRPSYGAWISAGQGVSATQNAAPTDNGTGRYGTVSSAGLTGAQFALGFVEFGGGPNGTFGDADDESGAVAAVVNFDPVDPSRLYVSRINAALNKPSNTAGNTSTASLGLGGVDSTGTLHLLADGYALISGSAVSDKRLIRVNPLLRNTASLNQINNSGGTDATPGVNRVLRQGQTSQTTPALIPASVASRPVMLGADFVGNFLFEQTANSVISTTTTAHLPVGGTARGPMTYTAGSFSRVANGASDAGTCLILSRGSGQTRTRGVSFWGVNVDGSLDSSARIELPGAAGQVVDPTDGFDPALAAGYLTMASQEFCNYASQVSFKGGSGPVAGVVLPGGDLLVSAACAGTGVASSTPASMDNYIAVGRVNAATGAVSWSVAAHTGSTTAGTGKIIKGDFGDDGIPGTADAGEGDGVVDTGPSAFIGRIVRYGEVFAGAAGGPSVSSPAMDALGNLYFFATVSLKRQSGTLLTTALLRANYNGATGAYELELLGAIGDVIAGQNSTLNYQVQFFSTADTDSVDSGSIFAGNIVQDLAPGLSAGDLGYGDARSLGALVVRCKIVYDRNNDGLFNDPTVSGNAGSPDQGYNVALVVMPGPLPPAGNPVDFNGDGIISPDDLDEFITTYFSEPPDNQRADFNMDGIVSPDDLDEYITAYFGV